MSASALVAARVTPDLKERARTVLEREGMTESQLIRRVYEYIVFLGEVPEVIKTGEFDMAFEPAAVDKFDELSYLINNGPFAEVTFPAATVPGDEDLKADALEGKFGYGFLEAHAGE